MALAVFTSVVIFISTPSFIEAVLARCGATVPLRWSAVTFTFTCVPLHLYLRPSLPFYILPLIRSSLGAVIFKFIIRFEGIVRICRFRAALTTLLTTCHDSRHTTANRFQRRTPFVQLSIDKRWWRNWRDW